MLHRYRFHSVWDLPAEPRRVYRVLADPSCYPRWWPEVREVRRLDEHSGVMRVRSLLPYELSVVVHETRQDPVAGVLEARLDGDIEGVTRWTVSSRGEGASVAEFFEDVEACKPLLRRFAVPGRPLFRANHTVMMRHGHVGLVRHLAVGSIGLDQ
jgi:uncharacterized protein YndB with AHSA1/START domain